MSKALQRHPLGRIERSEKNLLELDWFDRTAHTLYGRLKAPLTSRSWFGQALLKRAAALEKRIAPLTDREFEEEVLVLRNTWGTGRLDDTRVALAFAMIRETARRKLGLRHYNVQLLGGLALLKGRIAEMRTGEGKTLTATLAAATAAMNGVPVHVITVNDYLAERDAEEMRPIYEALGLTVGCITHNVPAADRQRNYDCDVVYATNKEIAFDYLRDQVVLQKAPSRLRRHAECLKRENVLENELLISGLHFAIVDEADSVLLDEARTPLILAGIADAGLYDAEFYRQALDTAQRLEDGRDFTLRRRDRHIELTPEGEWHVLELTATFGPEWESDQHRLKQIHLALQALHLFELDQDYIISEGEIVIIDRHTGRGMPDRQWEEGLHQLIQVKEGCDTTSPQETKARLTYQKFFRRYQHLCGMTGTAEEVRNELWNVYGLATSSIPTNKPVRLKWHKSRVCETLPDKWRAICWRVADIRKSGQPVLIGTNSVADSEVLSEHMKKHEIAHLVLNARQEGEESRIISEAGRAGRVTIATAMAGRGTDIKLGPGVAELGGLHVILSEFQESARLDRQLAGRSGRQGDPGSAEYIFGLEGGLFDQLHPAAARFVRLLRMPRLKRAAAIGAMRWCQWRNEMKSEALRRRLLRADEREEQILALSASSH